ncbi:DMT family transporter [Octadecabacter sp. 1_MG-2023]|uniref:DMT family transporter n=1 Tax=unclassified Octadecabacter TaxID=196158 RepID=UPI001C09C3D1|nr:MULTISPECIES: DMT family transporter [unclassified Octadecabacter]MBU2992756.1 DMT family transporter [Octadecabacter sp. B2R22]MDO6733793.1 DMT family transporter [Octadecabacter sp. 1_MG-2023]
MLTSMTLIVGGDVAAKVLSQDGISPIFVAWTRFALASVLLIPFSGLTRSDAPALRDPGVWLRALLIMAGISCILTALRTEPVANAFGAFFVGPIVAYVLSVIVLKEKVTTSRTLLLGLSFIGVLLVVKPGFGATIGMGFAILAGVFHGSYVVATRWIAPRYRPRLLLISQLVLGAILLAPFGLAARPEAITWGIFGLIAISAIGSAIGNLLLVSLSKTTPSSIIAPLIYTQLLSATLLGYLVFSDWPDWIAFVGLAVIFASGVASLALSRNPR